MTFSDRLRQTIIELAVTKKEFAKGCGISLRQLYYYINGKYEPSASFFYNLKKSYPNISLEWLITGQGDKTCDISLTVVIKMLRKICKKIS